MPSSHSEPPETLDTPLEIDPGEWQARQIYFLMTGMVIPRPIGWISTVSADGVNNLAPHSYFNAVAHDPPHVMFSSSGIKDTLRNIKAVPEFVVNIVTLDLVERMNFTSTDFPETEDEFSWADLTPTPSRRVRPLRVGVAKSHLECCCSDIVQAGNGHIVIGEVVHIHVEPSVWKNGRIDPALLNPVCRLAGSGYAQLGNIFDIPRPAWRDVQHTTALDGMPGRRN